MKKINSCCRCGSNAIKLWKTSDHHKVFAECEICHFCGKSKRSVRSAVRAWNREKRPRMLLADSRSGRSWSTK